MIVENIIQWNVIIICGAAKVASHILKDGIFIYHPLNISLFYTLKVSFYHGFGSLKGDTMSNWLFIGMYTNISYTKGSFLTIGVLKLIMTVL